MTPRTIAIGDIHGCSVALRTLVDALQPRADDVVVTLGDCVDRGPDTRGVIEQLLQLRDLCKLVPLVGNHEEMMLDFLDDRPQADDWLAVGGAATLASYGTKPNAPKLPDEHVAFVRSWGDWFETADHFFVHGRYEADLALADQRWHLLRWIPISRGIPEPHCSGKRAVVGHTSQKTGEILDAGHLVCIDTYCYGGGWLTALDTTCGQVWQATNRGELRDL